MDLETELLCDPLSQVSGAVAAGGALLTVYGREAIQRLVLRPGESWVIGREPPADLLLSDGSLSRQHARLVASAQGRFELHDLGSTNGSLINGVRVSRGQVQLGDQVTLGAVTLALTAADGAEGASQRLQSHERFQLHLREEAERCRAFGRGFALLMIRVTRPGGRHAGQWVDRLGGLRHVDRLGLYAEDCVELLLPETSAAAARALAEQQRSALESLRPLLGLGCYPADAGSVAALLERCRAALNRSEGPALRLVAGGGGAAEEGNAEATRGVSATMQQVMQEADQVAASGLSVLIQGETGVGKELLARRIHQRSGRTGRLCAVNCGAIPAPLVESSLFGAERGAFTGAEQRREGLFEAARGGTLLLDEVGELPLAAQAALLRVLDSGQVTRVGGTQPVAVDVRVLAATHRDLEQMVHGGRFREDLLWRLNPVTLHIPPLRQRREEIPALARRLVQVAARSNQRPEPQIAAEALALLQRHLWPGNVRELRNVLERGVVICQDSLITVDDLPSHLRRASRSPAQEALPDESRAAEDLAGAPASRADFKTLVQRYERRLILGALGRCDWNQSAASRYLGLPRRTLVHKMKALGIRKLGYGVEAGEGGP